MAGWGGGGYLLIPLLYNFVVRSLRLANTFNLFTTGCCCETREISSYCPPGIRQCPTPLYEDNLSVINRINNRVPTEWPCHIDIQHFAIQDWADTKETVLAILDDKLLLYKDTL